MPCLGAFGNGFEGGERGSVEQPGGFREPRRKGIVVGRGPWGNMFEFSTAGAAVVTLVYVAALRWRDLRYLGTFVIGPVLLTLGLAITVQCSSSGGGNGSPNGPEDPAPSTLAVTTATAPPPVFIPVSAELAAAVADGVADAPLEQAAATRMSASRPPGRYRVVVVRGPEYGHLSEEITVQPNQESVFKGVLKRLVDTKGWISADFHNHSTPSGDNVCDTDGRLVNIGFQAFFLAMFVAGAWVLGDSPEADIGAAAAMGNVNPPKHGTSLAAQYS